MKFTEQLEARWQAWWQELALREQRLIGGGAILVALALLWWVALTPALRTLSNAPAEHARLDEQLQRMDALRTQAQALQAQPRGSRNDALRALESSVRQTLGPEALLQATGSADAVGLAIRSAPANALGDWLAQARNNARAIPREVHLTRSQVAPAPPAVPGRGGATPAPAPATTPSIRWDGTLVMGLPASR